jgi:hypothetical protein
MESGKMITEKTVKKTRFFTTDGTDIWKVAHVKTLTEVELVNCENGKAATIRLGEQSTIGFVPVVMPVRSKTTTPAAPTLSCPSPPFLLSQESRGAGESKSRGQTAGVKVKAKTATKTDRGCRPGKKQSSKHLGVTVRTNKKGKKRFVAQIAQGGKYKALGSYKTEELAAAAVQEYLGNSEEAARLRKLAEQKTDQEIGQLKEETEITAWDCSACGKGYQYKPDVCGKCGGCSFTPARPEKRE